MVDLVNSLFSLANNSEGGQERDLYRLICGLVAEVDVARPVGSSLGRLVVPTRDGVARAFPGLGMYWSLSTPLDMYGDQEATVGDAVDDLLSVLGDLKAGVSAGDEAETLANWRTSFHAHWGRHSFGLQVALGAGLVAGTLPTTSTKS
jgi:hypothetical protein